MPIVMAAVSACAGVAKPAPGPAHPDQAASAVRSDSVSGSTVDLSRVQVLAESATKSVVGLAVGQLLHRSTSSRWSSSLPDFFPEWRQGRKNDNSHPKVARI